MAGPSSIEWTEATWNPVRGCVKVSPGCKHCYAETFAERFRGVPGHPYEQGFDPRLAPDQLGVPLRWRKPRTVFVNSMSDLFGDFVPDAYVAASCGVMAATPRHTYQVLTKRAERLPEWFARVEKREQDGTALFPDDEREWRIWQMLYVEARRAGADVPPHHGGAWPLPNLQLGVSVEDRKYGLPRIEHLRKVPAALRFLSIEPLLEDLGDVDLSGIGWVIVGGESGPGARPFDLALARRIQAQCREQSVPFFFKQAGADPVLARLPEWHETPGSWRAPMVTRADGLLHIRLKNRKGGDLAELPPDLRVREMPRVMLSEAR